MPPNSTTWATGAIEAGEIMARVRRQGGCSIEAIGPAGIDPDRLRGSR
jgi:hypothetical protein